MLCYKVYVRVSVLKEVWNDWVRLLAYELKSGKDTGHFVIRRQVDSNK
jgi:hypothetical protein